METIDFSFEDALKHLDEVAQQMTEEVPIPHCDTLTDEAMLPGRLVQVNCTAMYVRVVNNTLEGNVKVFAFHTAMNLIMKIVLSSYAFRRMEFQTDGGLVVLFDTPMKKDVEEIINVSARVRSINGVVLQKLKQDLQGQIVTVGIDFGPIEGYCTGDSIVEYYFAGETIETAKQLTDVETDCVVISEDIFINLPENMTTELFGRKGESEGLKYHYSRLINTMMQKWVDEQQDKG